MVSNMTFVLLLFVPHLSFFWYLEMAVLRGCGISWVSFIVFFLALNEKIMKINMMRNTKLDLVLVLLFVAL